MKKTVFLKNAAILTVTSLLLRFLGIVFKIWLAAAVGAEGIGLYQIVFSVYMLAATFASSGISTAVTRLIAEETALGSQKGVFLILRRCIAITLLIALFSTAVLFFGGNFIAGKILGEMRAAPAIRVLSFSLPFMGIASCLRGYFIAVRRAAPSAFSQLLEQIIRIFTVLFLIDKFSSHSLEITCAAVLLGDTVAEIGAVLFLWWLTVLDKRKLSSLSGRSRPPFSITGEVLHIAAPITAGRYLNSALRTAENVLVPKGLEKYGGGTGALSQFGMIKGMALPLLFFPSTLLNALSTLLIPEVSEASAKKQFSLVKAATERILQITSLISFIFAAIFLTAGNQIGVLVYKSETVGFLLCALSPIVPLMYLDSVCDGILKGLDQQGFCFRTSVSDSVLRIILVLLILPSRGMAGFIGIMYISNLLTCFLNVGRLIKVSKAKLNLTKTLFLPIASALSITLLLKYILCLLPLHNLVYIILLVVFSLPLYFLMLFAFGSITTDELRDVLKK